MINRHFPVWHQVAGNGAECRAAIYMRRAVVTRHEGKNLMDAANSLVKKTKLGA